MALAGHYVKSAEALGPASTVIHLGYAEPARALTTYWGSRAAAGLNTGLLREALGILTFTASSRRNC